MYIILYIIIHAYKEIAIVCPLQNPFPLSFSHIYKYIFLCLIFNPLHLHVMLLQQASTNQAITSITQAAIITKLASTRSYMPNTIHQQLIISLLDWHHRPRPAALHAGPASPQRLRHPTLTYRRTQASLSLSSGARVSSLTSSTLSFPLH
jgi:hypothetical protein